MTQVTQFKIGDKVRVLRSDWPSAIPVDTITTVLKVSVTGGVDLPNPESGGSLYFYKGEVELVESEKVEIGDTVEITYDDGTFVRGAVSYIYVPSGSFDVGDGRYYVASEHLDKVKIIEKVKKPKVWAVGGVLQNDDYASETILDGTLAGCVGDSVIKYRDKWTDVESGNRYELGGLGARRTIVYIPEVSA